jgi:hypothetical protein
VVILYIYSVNLYTMIKAAICTQLWEVSWVALVWHRICGLVPITARFNSSRDKVRFSGQSTISFLYAQLFFKSRYRMTLEIVR